MWRRLVVCVGAGLFSLAVPVAALAQNTNAALQAEFDALYQRLLKDPSDRELNRQLILLAVELKDYDAAIGSVERLIFYEPNDANLQIQAARLYLQIKSYAAATGYLKDVLALPGLSDILRQQATELTAEIEEATRPSIWAAFVQAGARYQTNANVGPESLSANAQTFLDPPIADWNLFGLGTVALNAPVGENLVIEGSVSAYYADQFKVDRLDLGFGEITGGPRFQTDDGAISFMPYGLVQGILLGDDPYQRALGGGASARTIFAEGWYLEPQFQYRNRRFYNSDDYTVATDQTGDLFTYSSTGRGQFSENFSWISQLAFAQNRADEEYQSYDQYAARLAPQFDFELFGRAGWSFSPFGGVIFTDYKALAPEEIFIGIGPVREDLQWNVGATLEVPLVERTGFEVQVQYTNNESNLERFTYENVQVTLGPLARF